MLIKFVACTVYNCQHVKALLCAQPFEFLHSTIELSSSVVLLVVAGEVETVETQSVVQV